MSRYPEFFRHLEHNPKYDLCSGCMTIVDRYTKKRNPDNNNLPLCDSCFEDYKKDELSW